MAKTHVKDEIVESEEKQALNSALQTWASAGAGGEGLGISIRSTSAAPLTSAGGRGSSRVHSRKRKGQHRASGRGRGRHRGAGSVMAWEGSGGAGGSFANGEGGASFEGRGALTAHDLATGGGESSFRKRKRHRGAAKEGRSRSLEARSGRSGRQSRFKSASRRRENASERLSYDEFKAVADAFRWWKKVDSEQKREERRKARAALNWVKATEFWSGATLRTRFHRWRLSTRAFRSKKSRLSRYVDLVVVLGWDQTCLPHTSGRTYARTHALTYLQVTTRVEAEAAI